MKIVITSDPSSLITSSWLLSKSLILVTMEVDTLYVVTKAGHPAPSVIMPDT